MTPEEDNLRSSWDSYPSEYLDGYLIQGVEDPRINAQSILTRAWLSDTLYPGRFDALITEELRFGAVLTWILRQLEQGAGRAELHDAILSGDTQRIPEFLCATYAWLQGEACPIPDYLTTVLSCLDPDRPNGCLSDLALDTFMTIWSEQLASLSRGTISVLEVACGSANDYRFVAQCGLAPFLRYTGLDIAVGNITNAQHRFPNVDFRVGSILGTELPDSSCDYLFCHDLIEHLSPAAMERALEEMLRIARREMILHFFNGKRNGVHEIVPVRKYYRNRLSMEKIAAFFEGQGTHVTCLEMAPWLREKIGVPGYHNPNAFSVIVDRYP